MSAAVGDAGALWRRSLAMLSGAWLVLLVIFHSTAIHLVSLWWNSSTFSHCLILLPIIGWLVWLRREELARLRPYGWMPGLIPIAGGAMCWMLGEAASVAILRHTGLMVMLIGVVPALLGPQVTRGLTFPLWYALFLIPAGEELVPVMQHATADMAMVLLRMTGIPAHLEGIFITTPNGYFRVAEACSGVKFLVAMAALAVLAAHLCFQQWRRRVLFVLFAMTTAALANGLRAFGTIWMAERWGAEFAVGADHLIYGWIFFALVILLIGLVARRWFDRDADAVPIDGARLAAGWRGRSAPEALVLTMAALIAIAPAIWLAGGDRVDGRTIAAPVVRTLGDWRVFAPPNAIWRARFDGAAARTDWRLISADGQIVDLVVARFADQRDGAEMVGFGQGAVDPDGDWSWSSDAPPIDGMRVQTLRNAGRTLSTMTLYRVGDNPPTDAPVTVKWQSLRARLLRSDESATAIIMASESVEGVGGRDAIAALVQAAGGVDPLVRRLTQQR